METEAIYEYIDTGGLQTVVCETPQGNQSKVTTSYVAVFDPNNSIHLNAKLDYVMRYITVGIIGVVWVLVAATIIIMTVLG